MNGQLAERLLGIDYGDARIGTAISDPLGITARGLETINWNGKDNTWAVDRLVSIDRAQEGFSHFIHLPKFLDGALEYILVANPPNGGESRFFKILLLDEPVIAVIHRERAHPIEEAAPAIQEEGGITVPLEDAGNGFHVVRQIPLHDGIARQGRE